MEANGAPEKLYLLPNGLISYCRTNEDDIEYVRKDAFIEKACEFISLNVADYIDVTHKGGIEHLVLQERFIDDFKNYIKEE